MKSKTNLSVILAALAFAFVITGCSGMEHSSTLPSGVQSLSDRRGVSSKYPGILVASDFATPYAISKVTVASLRRIAAVSPSVACPQISQGCVTTPNPKPSVTPNPTPTASPVVRFTQSPLSATTTQLSAGAPVGTRSTKTVDGSDGFDGHGTQGFIYQTNVGESGNGDVWIAMDVIQQRLADPISTNQPYANTLFAPTMKGPNGNCLEASIVNADGPISPYGVTGSTTMWFQVYDWCRYNGDPTNNGGYGTVAYSTLIATSNFEQNYVRVFTNGDGRPQLQVELFLNPVNQTWNAMLYNVSDSRYDIVYTSAEATAPTNPRGWLMFEYYYEIGNTCSPLQQVGASGNRESSDGNAWGYFNQGSAPEISASTGGNQSCFQYDSSDSNDPYYLFNPVPNDYGFYDEQAN